MKNNKYYKLAKTSYIMALISPFLAIFAYYIYKNYMPNKHDVPIDVYIKFISGNPPYWPWVLEALIVIIVLSLLPIILGLIFFIVKRKDTTVIGYNYALAAIIFGIFAFGLNIHIISGEDIIPFPGQDSSPTTPSSICLSNVKQLRSAMVAYTIDYDGYLPPKKADWIKLQHHYSKNDRLLTCPNQPTQPNESGYALNKNLDNINILSDYHTTNNSTIMIFESVNGINPRGGKELLAHPTRHGAGYNFGFVDGHAKWMKKSDVNESMWHYSFDKKN